MQNYKELKTEEEKIKYIRYFFNQIARDETEVRKEIGKVWALKKSARNAKFKKLFKSEPKTFDDLIKLCNDKVGELQKQTKAACFKPNGDSATAEVKGVDDIRTLEDLVEYCQVDLEEWEPIKFYANCYAGNFQAKAEFKRKVDKENLEKLLETFIKQAEAVAPKSFEYKKPAKTANSFYILSVVDSHVGKLAYGKETGYQNYDLNIAKEFYRNVVNDLVNNAPVNKIKKIGIIIGSDTIHYENQRLETSSGTKIEGDSRWHKIFDDTCELMVETIESLGSAFEVEVIVMPGNHARLTEYAMGAYIKSYFRNHKNVTVDNRPLPRKYFSHGKTLIGISHGDNVKKLNDLGALLYRENLDIISQHKHFYYLTGHKHQFQSVVDERGVRIFVSAAICPPDQWHSESTYVGNVQGSEAYLFDPEDGLTQIIFSKPTNNK